MGQGRFGLPQKYPGIKTEDAVVTVKSDDSVIFIYSYKQILNMTAKHLWETDKSDKVE